MMDAFFHKEINRLANSKQKSFTFPIINYNSVYFLFIFPNVRQTMKPFLLFYVNGAYLRPVYFWGHISYLTLRDVGRQSLYKPSTEISFFGWFTPSQMPWSRRTQEKHYNLPITRLSQKRKQLETFLNCWVWCFQSLPSQAGGCN